MTANRRIAGRAVAGIVALALAALPASVAVCAVLCASSGSTGAVTAGSVAHTHHTAGTAHHESSTGPRLQSSAAATHPCGAHDANIQRRKARLTPRRSDTESLWAFAAHALPRAAIGQRIAPHIRSGHGPPPGPSGPLPPLVLRI